MDDKAHRAPETDRWKAKYAETDKRMVREVLQQLDGLIN